MKFRDAGISHGSMALAGSVKTQNTKVPHRRISRLAPRGQKVTQTFKMTLCPIF